MIKKVLKGIVFISVFSVFTLLANAAECTEPEHDTQTTLNRALACNATNYKTTRFSYPQTGQEEVFRNSLCTIKCNEDLLLLIDSAKNVRAGMGFSFPLYSSGQRTCTATYNYQAFDTNLKNLVTSRNAATGNAKNAIINQISNQLQEKQACDEWATKTTKYNMSGTVFLEVETSENVTTVPYTFVGFPDGSQSTVSEANMPYSSCDLNGNPRANCTTKTETLSSWTEVARLDGRYTMSNRYIEKYTGKIEPIASEKTCDAKDVFFTSFYEVTRPVSTNPTDKGYSLKLTANNIGNNIKVSGDKWNLTVDCWYALKNLIFPQKTTTVTDEYYNLFGNTGFMYRPVDLETPFPNRAPGENWAGKERLITSTRSGIHDKVEYEIILNSDTIRKIKEYNDHYKYDTFDFTNEGKSKFIEANSDIIRRR